MATIKESRPGHSVQVELGGSYAQPNASIHSTWTGQTIRQLNWSGERNAGQPVYAAFDYNQSQTEIDARFRTEAGEALEQAMADPQNANVRNMQDGVTKNRLTMQLLTLAENA